MTLKLTQIRDALQAEVVVGHENLEMEVDAAFGTDLMSDMLRYPTNGALLLTGLTNIQVLRSSVISGVAAVLLVRGKRPGTDMVEQAVKHKVPILTTPLTMFTCCGMLFGKGLRGVEERVRK